MCIQGERCILICTMCICHSQKCKRKIRAGGLEYWTEMGDSQLGLLISATFQVPTPQEVFWGRKNNFLIWSLKRWRGIQMKPCLIIVQLLMSYFCHTTQLFFKRCVSGLSALTCRY